MTLQKSRLQENRMANFAYEPVSMPASRVSSKPDASGPTGANQLIGPVERERGERYPTWLYTTRPQFRLLGRPLTALDTSRLQGWPSRFGCQHAWATRTIRHHPPDVSSLGPPRKSSITVNLSLTRHLSSTETRARRHKETSIRNRSFRIGKPSRKPGRNPFTATSLATTGQITSVESWRIPHRSQSREDGAEGSKPAKTFWQCRKRVVGSCYCSRRRETATARE